jgi:hypothetical protein
MVVIVPKAYIKAGKTQQKGSTNNNHFTCFPITDSTGRPLLSCIIFKGASGLKEEWMSGVDVRAGTPGFENIPSHPYGPECIVNGLRIPCHYAVSEGGGMTEEILAECRERVMPAPNTNLSQNPSLSDSQNHSSPTRTLINVNSVSAQIDTLTRLQQVQLDSAKASQNLLPSEISVGTIHALHRPYRGRLTSGKIFLQGGSIVSDGNIEDESDVRAVEDDVKKQASKKRLLEQEDSRKKEYEDLIAKKPDSINNNWGKGDHKIAIRYMEGKLAKKYDSMTLEDLKKEWARAKQLPIPTPASKKSKSLEEVDAAKTAEADARWHNLTPEHKQALMRGMPKVLIDIDNGVESNEENENEEEGEGEGV